MAPGALRILEGFYRPTQVEYNGRGRFIKMAGGVMVFFKDNNALELPEPIRGFPIQTPGGEGILTLQELGRHTEEQWREFAFALKEMIKHG